MPPRPTQRTSLARGRVTVDLALKQRLVGAIVLVALAVIFLPMLLDGSGQSGPRDIAIELPPEPQPPRNRLEDDLADTSLSGPADGGESGPEIAVSTPASSERGEGSSDDEAGGAQDRADSGEADEPSTAASDGSGAADADGNSSSAEASAESARPSADAEGWVVQVGSFTRETNALVLRDRLREDDYDAFTEQSSNGERTLWRVRIGPVATREEADRLSERVTDQRGEPTLVMSHP